jgi:hypothetical protein
MLPENISCSLDGTGCWIYASNNKQSTA